MRGNYCKVCSVARFAADECDYCVCLPKPSQGTLTREGEEVCRCLPTGATAIAGLTRRLLERGLTFQRRGPQE